MTISDAVILFVCAVAAIAGIGALINPDNTDPRDRMFGWTAVTAAALLLLFSFVVFA